MLEQKLEKNLLYLPCRYNTFTYELVLNSAFEVCIAMSSGHETGLFKQVWDDDVDVLK